MLGELRKYLQFCTPFHSVCQFTDETYVPLARCGAVRMSWGAWGCTSHRCSGESGAWHRFIYLFAKMLYLCTTSLPLWCLCAHLFRLSVSDAFLFVPVCLVSAIMLPDIPRGTTAYYYVLARTTKTGKTAKGPKILTVLHRPGTQSASFFFKSRVYDYFSSFDSCVVYSVGPHVS